MKPVESSLPQDASFGETVQGLAAPSDSADEGDQDEGPTARPLAGADQKRLRAIFDAHYDFAWRLLRRLGLDGATADDGAQQVFMVAAKRLSDIDEGKERAFVAGTAVRIASRLRKERARRDGPPVTGREPSDKPSPEDRLDKKKQRELPDWPLAEMEDDLRVVLVLAEMDGYGKRELASLLGIPEGTAASRLRRAREDFQERLARRLARGRAK